MVCNKWEETGLLFSSNELSTEEKLQYSEHLKTCPECADEYSAYTSMQQRFFCEELLGATPSAACDNEIRRVCADGRKKITTFSPFSVFVRKTVISLSLFAIGFVSVSYLTIKMSNNGQSVEMAQTGAAVTADSAMGEKADSTGDSLRDNNVNFAKTRGNLGLKGVVPVDLQNK